jgi:hypothetical protein
MIEGTKKMEMDAKEGRGYSSGIRMRDEGKNGDSEEKKRNKKKARTGEPNNNPLTRSTPKECKCGGVDHKRISSSRCPWKGLTKVEVAQNCAKRMSEIVVPRNGEETRLFLLQNLLRRLQRKGNENLEMAKNTYSGLVSILARHLKIPTKTLKHM